MSISEKSSKLTTVLGFLQAHPILTSLGCSFCLITAVNVVPLLKADQQQVMAGNQQPGQDLNQLESEHRKMLDGYQKQLLAKLNTQQTEQSQVKQDLEDLKRYFQELQQKEFPLTDQPPLDEEAERWKKTLLKNQKDEYDAIKKLFENTNDQFGAQQEDFVELEAKLEEQLLMVKEVHQSLSNDFRAHQKSDKHEKLLIIEEIANVERAGNAQNKFTEKRLQRQIEANEKKHKQLRIINEAHQTAQDNAILQLQEVTHKSNKNMDEMQAENAAIQEQNTNRFKDTLAWIDSINSFTDEKLQMTNQNIDSVSNKLALHEAETNEAVNGINEGLTTLSSAVENIQQDAQNILEQVDETKETVNHHSDWIENLETTETMHDSRLRHMEARDLEKGAKLDELDQKVNSLGVNSDAHLKSINSLGQRVDKHDSQLDSINERQSAFGENLHQLNNFVHKETDSLNERQDNLQGQVESNTNEIQNIYHQHADHKTNVGSKLHDLSELQNRLMDDLDNQFGTQQEFEERYDKDQVRYNRRFVDLGNAIAANEDETLNLTETTTRHEKLINGLGQGYEQLRSQVEAHGGNLDETQIKILENKFKVDEELEKLDRIIGEMDESSDNYRKRFSRDLLATQKDIEDIHSSLKKGDDEFAKKLAEAIQSTEASFTKITKCQQQSQAQTEESFERIDSKIEEHDNVLGICKKEFGQVNNGVNNLDAKVDRLNSEAISRINQNKETIESTSQILKSNINDLFDKLKQVDSSVDTSKKEIQRLDSSLQNIKTETQENSESFRSDVNGRFDSVSKVQESFRKDLHDRNEEHEKFTSQYMSDKSKQEKQMSQVDKSLSSQESKINSMYSNINEHGETINQLYESQKQADSNLNAFKSDFDSHKSKYKQTKKTTENQLKNVNQIIERVEGSVNEHKENVKSEMNITREMIRKKAITADSEINKKLNEFMTCNENALSKMSTENTRNQSQVTENFQKIRSEIDLQNSVINSSHDEVKQRFESVDNKLEQRLKAMEALERTLQELHKDANAGISENTKKLLETSQKLDSNFGSLSEKIDVVDNRVNAAEERIRKVDLRVTDAESNVEANKKGLESLSICAYAANDKNFAVINQRLDGVQKESTAVHGKVSSLEQKCRNTETEISSLKESFEASDVQVHQLANSQLTVENKLATSRVELDKRISELNVKSSNAITDLRNLHDSLSTAERQRNEKDLVQERDIEAITINQLAMRKDVDLNNKSITSHAENIERLRKIVEENRKNAEEKLRLQNIEVQQKFKEQKSLISETKEKTDEHATKLNLLSTELNGITKSTDEKLKTVNSNVAEVFLRMNDRLKSTKNVARRLENDFKDTKKQLDLNSAELGTIGEKAEEVAQRAISLEVQADALRISQSIHTLAGLTELNPPHQVKRTAKDRTKDPQTAEKEKKEKREVSRIFISQGNGISRKDNS